MPEQIKGGEQEQWITCPFDGTVLINVGSIAEFDDEKDNYCCQKCNRIWIDCDTDEWSSRPMRVEFLKEPEDGDKVEDVIKVKKIF